MADDRAMENTHTSPNTKTRLRRPRQGRVLGGVAAAIAEHTGASVGLVRLGFLVTALLGGFGVVLYLAAWALMPSDDEDQAPAERWMHDLTTPGKRLGAFLIGIAGLIVLAGAAPATVLAAATLLAAAALLSNDTKSGDPVVPATPAAAEKE